MKSLNSDRVVQFTTNGVFSKRKEAVVERWPRDAMDELTTRKLLVSFDPKKPDRATSDFLTPTLNQHEVRFVGLKSKHPFDLGAIVFIGNPITANDMLARVVDCGWKIESVGGMMGAMQEYVRELQAFKIGNVLRIVRTGNVTYFTLQRIGNTTAGALKYLASDSESTPKSSSK